MKPFVIAAIVSIALGTGAIAYMASIGGFNPSGATISDSLEGMETQQVENPAPPDHPAFPASNLSAAENTTAG